MLEKIVERAPLLVGEAVGIVVIAVLLSGVVVVVRRRTGAEAVALATTVRAGAFLVVAAWLLDNLSRMVVVVYPGIAWWTYALPIVVATVVLCVGADGSGAGARRRGEPRAVGTRRSWSSFVSPRLLWSALVAGGLLLATTIAAGLASSRDDVGRWAQLAFGNGAATSFYGWAYGVPVLIALALLVAIIGTRLRRIAAPPFPTALTLADERARRRRASDAVVTVGLCAVALSAGQVFAFLGRAGDAVVGAGIPGVGEFTWTTPYAGFAGAFEWGGWGLSVVAVAGLLTIGAGLLPGELRGRPISVRPRPAAPAR